MRSRLLTLSLSALLALGLVACSDTTDDGLDEGLADDPAVEAPADDTLPATTPDALDPTE